MEQNQTMVTPTGIAVALAVVIALGFLFFGSALFLPFTPAEETQAVTGQNLQANTGAFMVTDTVIGTGEEIRLGSAISVHYVGRLENGQVFDSSITRGEPFVFVLGELPIIQGWEQGLIGMKVGGKRTLVIPPELGYGAQAVGSIPPNSTLIFEIELLDVQNPQ